MPRRSRTTKISAERAEEILSNVIPEVPVHVLQEMDPDDCVDCIVSLTVGEILAIKKVI